MRSEYRHVVDAEGAGTDFQIGHILEGTWRNGPFGHDRHERAFRFTSADQGRDVAEQFAFTTAGRTAPRSPYLEQSVSGAFHGIPLTDGDR